ncbi:hypothetical protein QJQ45_021064, partial [Haematococcus lacustris]
PVSSALLTSLLFMPAQVLAPLQANNAKSEGLNGKPSDDSTAHVPALFVSPHCVPACQNVDCNWLQVIKVPGGAVLRGCKKTKRKLMAHFQLRAGVHSQLRVIASLFVLRIFLTCLVGYPTPGFRSAPTPPAVQPPHWFHCIALNMQRIGESKWRPLGLCFWPDQGALPAKGKEYPGLGYKRLQDKPPKAQEQQPAVAQTIGSDAPRRLWWWWCIAVPHTMFLVQRVLEVLDVEETQHGSSELRAAHIASVHASAGPSTPPGKQREERMAEWKTQRRQPASMAMDWALEPDPEPEPEPEPEPAPAPPTLRPPSARLAARHPPPAAPTGPPMPLDSEDPVMLQQLKRYVKLYVKAARARLGWSGEEAQLFIKLACGYSLNTDSPELQADHLDKAHVNDMIEEAAKQRRLLALEEGDSLQDTVPLPCRMCHAVHVCRCLEQWQQPPTPPVPGQPKRGGRRVAAGPSSSNSSPAAAPSAAAAAAHAVGLSRIGKRIAEQGEFVFNPATQIGVGIDPGVTQAVSAASGVWDPKTGQLQADQLRRWKLTKGQVKHGSGLNNARRDTERWLAPIKHHLQHLAAASSAGTSLEANLKHITVTLATWDAVWEVYLDPKWAEQRLRLYGAQDRTLEQFFKKVVCRTRGTDQRRGRVVLVDEHRTTRVSSAVNGQQPCERQLNKRRATRPAGWKPPAGQVEHCLVRPAWSQQREQPVRGMMWCPVVAPRKPPQAPRSSQEASQPAASEPGPSTPLPAKRSKRTKAEPAAEPNKAQGKATKAKPAPQPGRWLDRDCIAALNMQRIGESRWRPLELCWWPNQGALPAKGKEYPGLGYKRLQDKPPKAQQQQPAKELMTTIFVANEPFFPAYADMALQLVSEARQMGFAHFLLISNTQAGCDKMLALDPLLSCAWDSTEFNGKDPHVHQRLRFFGRAIRLGYNVLQVGAQGSGSLLQHHSHPLHLHMLPLQLDGDTVIFRDPYVYLKRPPLAGINNCRPDGPTAWVFRWLVEITLRLFAEVPNGSYSSAWHAQLRDDCPDCPWWDEQRPLKGGRDSLVPEALGPAGDLKGHQATPGQFVDEHIPKEIVGQAPAWFVHSMTLHRFGTWLGPGVAPLGSHMVIGHVHGWRKQQSQGYKIVVRKMTGRYNWTLAAQLTAPKAPYMVAQPGSSLKLLALAPHIDLERPGRVQHHRAGAPAVDGAKLATGQFSDSGISTCAPPPRSSQQEQPPLTRCSSASASPEHSPAALAALLSKRVAVLPQLPCETPWLHDQKMDDEHRPTDQRCIAPLFSGPNQDWPAPLPFPITPVSKQLLGSWTHWSNCSNNLGLLPRDPPLDVEAAQHDSQFWAKQRYSTTLTYLMDQSCAGDVGGLLPPEYAHWLQCEAPAGTQVHSSSSNTVLQVSPNDRRLHLQPSSWPGGERFRLAPGSVLQANTSRGWSWRDVQVSVSTREVARQLHQVAQQPLVYLGHPILLAPPRPGDRAGEVDSKAGEGTARHLRTDQLAVGDVEARGGRYRRVMKRLRGSFCRAMFADSAQEAHRDNIVLLTEEHLAAACPMAHVDRDGFLQLLRH